MILRMTAWISVLIAGLAFVFALVTYLIERGQRRTDIAQERRLREKELADERNLRQEELALLRRQVVVSERQQDTTEKARLSVRQGPASGGATADSYSFLVMNAGPAVAHDIAVELRHTDGTTVAGGPVVPPTLIVGQEGRAIVELLRGHRGEEIAIVVLWVDPSIEGESFSETPNRNSRQTGMLGHISPLP